MPTTPLHDTKSVSVQLSSPLGRLPRELRDHIYHFLFQETPYLIQRFSTYDTNTASPSQEKILRPFYSHDASNILYLRYRHHSNTQGPNRPAFPSDSAHPEWTHTCRMSMVEGTEVFMRNAEWYFNGYCLNARALDHWTYKSIQLDTSNVTAMHLYVNNLANFEEPFRYEGTNARADMEYFAKLMRITGMRLKEMRFVGHSYNLSSGAETCFGQAHNMMRNLVNIFHSIGVQSWSFGIVQPNTVGLWVLFDWLVPAGQNDADGHLNMIVREWPKRHIKEVKPEDDLERLLPPGWVKKRPECMCLDCREERKQLGTGGWGPRPDQFGGRAWERRNTSH